MIDETHFKFLSNQPTLSGTLKYDVNIESSSIILKSPATIWTVNVRTCTDKYEDWVTTQNPVAIVQYDVRNPPTSTVITTFPYLGPPLGACGNPTVTIKNGSNGPSIDFLTATFDATTSFISITLPDNSKAVWGEYTLYAVFKVPGEFSFPIGVSLEVFDICYDSVFPSAPVVVPDM